MKDINDWTKKEFEALPLREYGEDIGLFDSLVILQTKNVHESGFLCMDFVAVNEHIPMCRLSGCSDVIHIDGIAGLGEWDRIIPKSVITKGWRIDCLKKSKLLNLNSFYKLKAGNASSSFCLYSIKDAQ